MKNITIDKDPKEMFPNHCMLNYKGYGASKNLIGNVCFYIYLVYDAESSWNDSSMENFKNSLSKAIALLETKAKDYGKKLSITYAIDTISVKENINRHNYDTALNLALKKYSFQSANDFQDYYENKHMLDDSGILLVFNKNMRSFTAVATSTFPYVDECSFIGNYQDFIFGSFSHTAIVHEVLHQFGAKDYYYPETVAKYASRYIISSIMKSIDVETIDRLTAYLVGWTNTIDAATKLFLEATYSVTLEEIREARKNA